MQTLSWVKTHKNPNCSCPFNHTKCSNSPAPPRLRSQVFRALYVSFAVGNILKANFSHFSTERRGVAAVAVGLLNVNQDFFSSHPLQLLPQAGSPASILQKTQINEAICCALSCLISDAKVGAGHAAGRSQVENFLPPAIENC